MNRRAPSSPVVTENREFVQRGRARAIALSLLLWLVVAPPIHSDETLPAPDPATSVESVLGRYRAAYASTLEPLSINQIHSWVIQLQNTEGAPVEGVELSISGGMPAHDHGLPTAPRVTSNLGAGTYLVEGMKFHMGGAWEIVVQIKADSGTDTIRWEIHL